MVISQDNIHSALVELQRASNHCSRELAEARIALEQMLDGQCCYSQLPYLAKHALNVAKTSK